MLENKNPENLDDENEAVDSEEVLKGMVKDLNELPTDVLKQLLSNLDEIEAYNKAHPEEIDGDKK